MNTREPVVVARRRLTLRGKVYLPHEWIPGEAWARVGYAKRVTLAEQGYVTETAIPVAST